MPSDRAAIYKAQLRPPTGWTKAAAKKYQGTLLMSEKVFAKKDNDDVDVLAYPFLVFTNGLKSCKPRDKKYIKQRIITKRSPADSSTILTPTEQKEFDKATECKFKMGITPDRDLTDDEIIARGDKILGILSQMDPVSFNTVKTLLDKIPLDRIKPLSPSTVQTPPGTPVVQQLIKPAGPKMIIKQDFETYQSKDLDDYFYSPFGDITGPIDLKALHVGIKAAGIRKLIAINSMSNEYVERDNIEYDLRRYLAGLPTRYINQVRFNNALTKATAVSGDITDNFVVKSYHKITGVRQEKVETLTLTHKQWLLKGRAYDSKVLTALYPPHDKRFGYELWKIWASRMQKRLDRYMSQYTKPVTTDGRPGLAYATSTGVTIPVKPVTARIIAAQKQTPVALPVVQGIPVVTGTPVSTAATAVVAAATAVANAKQVVAQLNTITLNTKAVEVKDVDSDTVDKLAQEAAFNLSVPSELKVYELLHLISRIQGNIKMNETKTYKNASPETQKGLKQIWAFNSAVDREKNKLDNLKNNLYAEMVYGKLRGTTQIVVVDNRNDVVLFDGTRDSICKRYGTDPNYECDIVYGIADFKMTQLKRDEDKKYTPTIPEKVIKINYKLARIVGFSNRTLTCVYCNDLKEDKVTKPLDDVVIRDATAAECELAKQEAKDQVQAEKLEKARKEAEKKRKEDEKKRKEEEKARKEAEKKRKEEADRKAEEERLEKEIIRQAAEQKLKEEEEKLRKAEEDKKRLEEQKKKDELGTQLTKGGTFGDNDEFTRLKDGDDVLFIIKTSLKDDDKKEAKFKALREDKTGHLAKYWYIKTPEKLHDKIAVTLSGKNYHFEPSILDGEFVISEYAGTVLADDDDNVQVQITTAKIDSALAAVKAIHDLGYVHGDIKLVNMGFKDGKVKLFDFGESTMSFSDKDTEIDDFKKFCHKVPSGAKSLKSLIKENSSLLNKEAWKLIPKLGDTTIGKITEVLTRTVDEDGNEKAGSEDKDISLGGLKQLLLDSEYLLLQDIESEIKPKNKTLLKGLQGADAILFGGEAGTFSYIMNYKSPTLNNANGYMLITPPFTSNPLFGDIKYQERYKLYDYWALSLALLHMGDKQLKPYANPDKVDVKQKLSKLLFDERIDENKSWFSQKNPENAIETRFIDPITDDTILKILSIIVKGNDKANDKATAGEYLSKDTLEADLERVLDGLDSEMLRQLSEAWITGHYNLMVTQTKGYKYKSRFGGDDSQEELNKDLGTEFYGVSSATIRKIFEPLYNAIKSGTATLAPPRQSLFDYDSFSDAELDELSTEMEALDDEELEKLINDEMSYNSSSDSGRSNVVYESSSDTGRSNVAYDSSSDTGNSNAAYSYNSESEQSAAESYNNDSYNSDSDEDK